MKLEIIKIKNFRSYKDETCIPISNLTAFIGKNDAGKSSVLEALEIFFNNELIECEKDDLSINAVGTNIEISCVFSDFPTQIIIDSSTPTSLPQEYLLNSDGKLEIKKVFAATAAKPKEKIYIVCNHPNATSVNDLLELKRPELKRRAEDLGVPSQNYSASINSEMRHAIWQHVDTLNLQPTNLLVDKEDSKKVFEELKKYLPIFALFQSDRQSKDDDKEVSDPMKIAVQTALRELTRELEEIKDQVKARAVETANRTLEKLKEMSSELAQELIPEFKTEPKFDSQFKLTIKSEDEISINKRGSGVRRLILLNFFRAEAEKRRTDTNASNVIYAFEEPETSQHPDHQEMLVKAFIELSNSSNTQILLTTHTPALAGLLPLSSLRFIQKSGGVSTAETGSESVFQKIVDTLGFLPDPISKTAKAIFLVEGKSDVNFINHTSQKLKEGGFISHTFQEKQFAIVPIGGCGNLKHWRTLKLAEQFSIPWCILLDSDLGTNEEIQNRQSIAALIADGKKAYLTKKREPENYLHLSVLSLPAGSTFTFNDTDDAKKLIGIEKTTRKDNVLDTFWPNMTPQLIRQVEKYHDGSTDRYEFTEMFTDLLTLVS